MTGFCAIRLVWCTWKRPDRVPVEHPAILSKQVGTAIDSSYSDQQAVEIRIL